MKSTKINTYLIKHVVILMYEDRNILTEAI